MARAPAGPAPPAPPPPRLSGPLPPQVGLSDPSPSPAAEGAPRAPGWRHDLDAVRALALLLGVAYHAAHAYVAAPPVPWLVTHPVGSVALQHAQAISHLWRMPVFFTIAGYFAVDLMARRGIGGFARHRLRRLGLPFALFWPMLSVAMVAIILWANTRLGPSPLAQRGGGVHTMHLWFLEYLLLLCLAAAAAARWAPRRWARWGRAALRGPQALLWLPVALLPAALAGEPPLIAPTAITPAPWALAYYGLFFAFGAAAHGADGGGWRWGRWAALPAVTVAAGLPLWLSGVAAPGTVAEAALHALLAAHLVAGALCLAGRWRGPLPRPLQAVADASYWIYLVHLPVVLALQVWLAPLGLSPWLGWAAVTALTLAVGQLSDWALVRATPLGRLLNGTRRQRSRVATS